MVVVQTAVQSTHSMRISTGRTAALRESIRAVQAQNEKTTMAPEINSITSRVNDTRYSVFIEIRERGQDSVVCKSAITLERHVKRGRPRHRSNPLSHFGYQTEDSDSMCGINIIADITKGDYIEIYRTDKTGILSVRPAKIQNIMTPYVFAHATATKPEHEVFFSTEQFAVVATINRRQQFTRDVYALAESTKEPMHRISALKAMEQLFIGMVANSQIERTLALKKFEVYEKLSGLIWHGGTAGEQVAAFHRAWEVLANVTRVKVDPVQEDEENG